MANHKVLFIKDIREGASIDDHFLVKSASRAETRGGKPYLILTVMDRTGELGGRLWENADLLQPECRPGSIVLVKGQAQAYKGVLQLKIDAVKAVAESAGAYPTPEDFLPSTSGDIAAMAADLLGLAGSVREPYLKKLLSRFFQPGGEFFETFKRAPAAKEMHHAYYGGLLEHTLAVARLADAMATRYSAIDRGLLLAGALLHDIGKIEEFSYASYPFNYSDKGRLVGHLVLGTEMVQGRIETIKDFPEELAIRLKHLILSHHGAHEFGSPSLPMTLEAFVLNFIDDIDAKINYFGRLASQVKEPGYQWTEFQRLFDRYFFVRGNSLPEAETEELPQRPAGRNDPRDKSAGVSRQQSLFGIK